MSTTELQEPLINAYYESKKRLLDCKQALLR